MKDTTSNPIVSEDFLLASEESKVLYHHYAKELPIIDYHNHLPPKEVADNHRFQNITEVWLAGDHYKWRAMRANGVDEYYITGKASPQEKFQKWAETVPFTVRNPLYHWTHLELATYFEVNDLLSSVNAEKIYDLTSQMLQEDSHRVEGLLNRCKVETICTTDDPLDTLDFHHRVQDSSGIHMFPTFRPDRFFAIDHPDYLSWVKRLEDITDTNIEKKGDLFHALQMRIAFFHSMGCKISDHGLQAIPFTSHTENEIGSIFQKKLENKLLSKEEIAKFQTWLLIGLCEEYGSRDWVQQFHLGAIRNNNTRYFKLLGADAGTDSIGDFPQAVNLGKLLDNLDRNGRLAKTIVYNLNPRDNEVFISMVANFNDGKIAGKMQYGSAWWFLDQLDGMEKQINALSSLGLISRFVGMLTDSRSFLSFPRHAYFRRLLCSIFGRDMEKGLLPCDYEWMGKIIQDICYYNAAEYFSFKK